MHGFQQVQVNIDTLTCTLSCLYHAHAVLCASQPCAHNTEKIIRWLVPTSVDRCMRADQVNPNAFRLRGCAARLLAHVPLHAPVHNGRNLSHLGDWRPGAHRFHFLGSREPARAASTFPPPAFYSALLGCRCRVLLCCFARSCGLTPRAWLGPP